MFTFYSLLASRGEDLEGLCDLLLELEEIIEVSLDLLDGEVNKHTSDLRSAFLTNDLLNELIDELTDELLEVRVLWNDDGEETESLLIVSCNVRIWVVKWCGGSNSSVGVDDDLRSRLGTHLSNHHWSRLGNVWLGSSLSWLAISTVVVIVVVVWWSVVGVCSWLSSVVVVWLLLSVILVSTL